MEVHDEQRKNAPDRRAEDRTNFPFRDQEGTWVVTERRGSRDRRSGLSKSMAAQSGLSAVLILLGMLILAGLWLLLRFHLLDAPSWLPSWLIYPEIVIAHLL